MSWINLTRIQREGSTDWTPFDEELNGIHQKIVREKGSPMRFTRVDAAQFVTEVKDAGDAVKSFNEYLRFLSQPNLILNFPPRWLPWIGPFATSESLYDQIGEDLCVLLKRYYIPTEIFLSAKLQKKNKKSLD